MPTNDEARADSPSERGGCVESLGEMKRRWVGTRDGAWFSAHVADEDTGREFRLRLNESSADIAREKLWRMGFAIATLTDAAGLRPDPAMEKERSRVMAEVDQLEQPETDRRTLAERWDRSKQEAMRAAFKEILPDGAFGVSASDLAEGVLHCPPMSDESRRGSQRLRLSDRCRGAAFDAWTASSNRDDGATPRMLSLLEVDAHPIDRHYLLQNLGLSLINSGRRNQGEEVCWQWYVEFEQFARYLVRNPAEPPCEKNTLVCILPDALRALLEADGFPRRGRDATRFFRALTAGKPAIRPGR